DKLVLCKPPTIGIVEEEGYQRALQRLGYQGSSEPSNASSRILASRFIEDSFHNPGHNSLIKAVKKAINTEKRRQKSSGKTAGTSQDVADTRCYEFSKANDDNVHETMGSPDSEKSFGPYGPVTQVHDKAIEDTRRKTKRSPSTSTPTEVYE
ncbi:hypothetical protein Ancab_004663, partial [Ancistrocladus abbreviatus]